MSRLLAFFGLLSLATSYKPVVIIHGIFDNYKSMFDLRDFIVAAHPGTNVTLIDMYSDADSIANMWSQVHGFGKAVRQVMNEAEDGIHLIGFSQGGLVARGVIQSLTNHSIDTFVALSSPQLGQFGDTSYLRDLPDFVRDEMWRVFYSDFGQLTSIGNYWNDPLHRTEYLKSNIFLPILNGGHSLNPMAAENKTAFERLGKVVLIGGPDDGVITPWQSSHFGFYAENDSIDIIETTQQEIYINDWIGLKSIDQRGDLHMYEIPGVEHVHWHGNKTVFDCCIEKWLT